MHVLSINGPLKSGLNDGINSMKRNMDESLAQPSQDGYGMIKIEE